MSRASGPASQRHGRGIPAVPPVEIEDPLTPTPTGNVVRLRWRGLSLLVQGAQALYAAGLLGLWAAGFYLLPPLVTAVREATKSLESTAAELHAVASDAREAKAAAGRAEQGLDGLRREVHSDLDGVRAEVAALRGDVRACGGRR